MKKQGCDIEAIGINYTIYKGKPKHSLNITSKNNIELQVLQDKLEEQALPKVDQHTNPNPSTRHVLKDVSCRAKPWEILAIVGPSGAGKSSLLEILAGRLTPQSESIFVDQKPIEKSRLKKLSGYVTQKDILFPLLTVEETLMFSVKLRLRLPESELSSRVKALIQELGLSHVAGSRVGDDRVRGISGGERRRVSIGVEVIHDPKVLILDEPTSGLDSNSALQIMDMVKNMAETRGRTVILSIHQPGFRILKLFNSILLLANGSVVHHGTVDQLGVQLRLMELEIPLQFLLLIWLILYTANSVVVCFSALVPNFIVGNSVICGVMGSFFLFSGYFVSKNGMPKYWVFMHYISLFKYPFEGLLINEFAGGEGKCLEYMFGKCMLSGEELLREEGYGGESIWRNVVIMVCFILVYRFVSYVILRCRCSQRGLKGSTCMI